MFKNAIEEKLIANGQRLLAISYWLPLICVWKRSNNWMNFLIKLLP